MNERQLTSGEKWFSRYFAAVFLLLPLSVEWPVGNVQMVLPAEPLIGLGCLWLLLLIGRQWRVLFYAMRHPLPLAAVLMLGWAWVCVPFSNHQLVSVKYMLVNTAHWWFFLAGGIWMLRVAGMRAWLRAIDAYALSFSACTFYAWVQHAGYGFQIPAASIAMRPFYFDHALYGTAMAMLMLLYAARAFSATPAQRWRFLVAVGFFAAGCFLSFSRAVWMSMVPATLLAVWHYHQKRRWPVADLFLFILLAGTSYLFYTLHRPAAPEKLEGRHSVIEHLRSAVDFESNVSNRERLNRYSCAWRMFLQRPVVGYGPGSYIFDYYPFQFPEQMTRISLTEYGPPRLDKPGGSAHSELFLALSETGLPGALLWLFFVFAVLMYSASYRNIFFAACIAALGMFVFHSLFNTLSHSEKVMSLVWMYVAVLSVTKVPDKEP